MIILGSSYIPIMPLLQGSLGFYEHNRDINPRNQRALTLLGLLLECSLILLTLGQDPNLLQGGGVHLGFRFSEDTILCGPHKGLGVYS